MVAPFEIATKFLLRLLLPGAVIAAAAMPIMLAVCAALSTHIDSIAVFGFATLTFGWVLMLLDMPIYMLFEGRRYWPRWLRRLGVAREQHRLERYARRADTAKARGDEAARLEYRLQVSQFPMTPEGEYEAWYPTRLGNVLAGFEQYPSLKYGLDGVFFWYRLWVAIDKDLREDLDNAQALVDGSLYAVAAFLLAAGMNLVYAATVFWRIPWIELPASAGYGTFLVLSGTCLLVSIMLYRCCIHAQSQYGELFKSLFDQHRSRLEISALLDDLESQHADLNFNGSSERERNRAAWRFLRWHRYRPNGSRTNHFVEDW
jgi:hypothetical protein